jgi:hypothetical protein
LTSGSRGAMVRRPPQQPKEKMGTKRLLLAIMKRIRIKKEKIMKARRMEKMMKMMKMTMITMNMMTTMMTFTMTITTMTTTVESCCPFLTLHSDEFS